MRLTAMDISNKEFKREFRGYNVDEVDEFLNAIMEDYEALYKENSMLKENLSRTEEKLEHYIKVENTIQNTLLLAQNAAEQTKGTSQKEAELIIKNANDAAKNILDKAHNDVIAINNQHQDAKQNFIKFKAQFRNFMNAQLQTFDELEKDLTKSYGITKEVAEDPYKDQFKLPSGDLEEFNEPKEIEEFEPVYNEDINDMKTFFAKK